MLRCVIAVHGPRNLPNGAALREASAAPGGDKPCRPPEPHLSRVRLVWLRARTDGEGGAVGAGRSGAIRRRDRAVQDPACPWSRAERHRAAARHGSSVLRRRLTSVEARSPRMSLRWTWTVRDAASCSFPRGRVRRWRGSGRAALDQPEALQPAARVGPMLPIGISSVALMCS